MGKHGFIILKTPLKPIFMSKYQKNIGPSNKDQSPFTYCMSIQLRKEAKIQLENPTLNMDRKQNFGNIVINHSSPHDQKSPAMI